MKRLLRLQMAAKDRQIHGQMVTNKLNIYATSHLHKLVALTLLQ